jgi:PhzF family phenazine biosynthesis protein
VDLKIFQVAAFTAQSFGGNPAAVLPLDEWLDDAVMQAIAAENNLSETAFFVPVADNEWHIRWFTPAVEVPLCGHATLASAAVIDRITKQVAWPITLRSASGQLSVDTDGDAYTLNFPSNKAEPVEIPAGLESALGSEILELRLGRDIYMALLADESSVAGLRPNFSQLRLLIEHGITVTAPGSDVDFVSRFFAPAIGLDEDPVTGAAHCLLTPYWSERLGRKRLRARQISSRVGDLECEDLGDRVLLQGRVVFFLSGTIKLADGPSTPSR